MKHVVVALLCCATVAAADPLRLRGDAYATTQSPAGLLTLQATGEHGSNLSAEAVVWTAEGTGDVLVIALRAHALHGRATATLGRFVATVGALRPVHVDGAGARLRLPYRFDVEAYAGIPVAPGFERSWDWLAATRVSRKVGDWGSVGIAYLHQRDAGQLASEELGFDAGAAFGKDDSAAAKVAYDIANPGLAAVTLIATHRKGALRADVFASHREASHLLPATSLFSVLGDVPAERGGTTLTWKAAPRLDVGGDIAARKVGDDIAPELVARAKLKLDARGVNAVSFEARRDGVADDERTGLRTATRIALPHALTLGSEFELVIPDVDRGLGRAWPWFLTALAWDRGAWHAAIAGEASASPTDVRRFDVLATLGWSAL
jgi:hypothetical protein